MRRFTIATFFLFCSAAAYAHAPTAIVVTDDQSGGVYLQVMHPVSDSRDHFVKRVEIVVGDEAAVTESFTFQTTPGYQRVTLDGVALPKKKTEKPIVITITAYCNKGGDVTQEFTPQELKLDTK